MPVDRHFDTGEYDPRRYWNRRAQECDGDLYRTVCGYELSSRRNAAMDRLQRHVLSSLLRGSLADGRLLDFGCGVGRLTSWFLDQGAWYTGVDVAPRMLIRARDRHPDRLFALTGQNLLPFADGCFEVVVSVTVLQHNPYHLQRQWLSELLRVTRPGGRILLMERVGPRRQPGQLFTVYPRPLEEWVEEMTQGGAAQLESSRRLRWWILADLAAGAARRFAPAWARRWQTMDKILVSLGSRVDPILLPWLPGSRCRAAAMLFRRAG